MFLKLLLTALVIAGALLTLRMRSQRRLNQYAPEPRVLKAPGRDVRAKRMPQLLAAGAVLLMLIGASLYLYHQWRDAYQLVSIHVIDTRSGQSSQYQAYKGDIEGRKFTTTDGRVVTLAEVERMETGAD
ncbi:antitermination protein NusG [Sedimenticola selenatireducens]|uniref:Antitermination protein NusG n=1 Tax=Sedimenticola selenatireducens TaxID=191960 RepID=A0A557SD12_9GAMM|nr:antitermination protein NusG [Sedimenticola selenatireducens]TVO75299.1 antitermination protein NusG [Sedimenticola selenatireducens]TVT66848.1 MAG: antitermination protein NusG [Sedimenticola selenatireducens]